MKTYIFRRHNERRAPRRRGGHDQGAKEKNRLLELLVDEPIFIGFKVGRALRQVLEALHDTDKKYVSSEDSAFLRLCSLGEDLYVGKLTDEALATDRVDDIRRNILSILRKLGPAVPLPTTLRIFACRVVGDSYAPEADVLGSSASPLARSATRAGR